MMRSFIQNNRAFVIIAFAAIVVQIAVFCMLNMAATAHPNALHSSFPVIGGGGDSLEYETLATNLLCCGTFSLGHGPSAQPETFRTPAYPAFVAAVIAVTGTIKAVPLFQLVLLILSAFLLYEIVLHLIPGRKGLAAAAVAIFLFDPIAFFIVQFVTTESLYICFLLVSVYVFIKPPYLVMRYALAGACFGLSVLVRPSGMLLLVPFVCYLIWRLCREVSGRRQVCVQAIVYVVATALILLPWYIRNEIRTGVFGLSSVSAYNLFYFNVPQYIEYSSHTPIEETRARLIQEAGGLTDSQMRDIRSSAALSSIVGSEMHGHLAGYAVFHLSKTANFFMASGAKFTAGFLDGFSDDVSTGTVWDPSTSLVNSILNHRWHAAWTWVMSNALYLPESALLLLVTFLSIAWLSLKRSKDAWFIVGIILVFAVTSGQLSNARYREPAAPFMYMSAAAGMALCIDYIVRRLTRKRGSLT